MRTGMTIIVTAVLTFAVATAFPSGQERSCRKAVQHADELVAATGDYTKAVSGFPVLVADAGRAGMSQDVAGLRSVSLEVDRIAGEVNSVADVFASSGYDAAAQKCRG